MTTASSAKPVPSQGRPIASNVPLNTVSMAKGTSVAIIATQ